MLIDEMMAMQAKQQTNWYDTDNMSPQERSQWTDELLLGLYEEVGELSRAIRERTHVVPERAPDGNVIEEVVDTLKYLLALAHLQGVSGRAITDAFLSKTVACEQRFKQRKLDLEGRKVLVTDIDPFVEEFGAYGKAKGGVELEQAKGRWYEAGKFLTLPRIKGAIPALQRFRDEGYLIAIITARPVWEHRRVRGDTVKWLEENGVPHDILLFDKDKYDALVKHVLPARVVTFIEDRDKHAIELAAHGIPVTLINKSYNQTLAAHECITRVDDWADIVSHVNLQEATDK